MSALQNEHAQKVVSSADASALEKSFAYSLLGRGASSTDRATNFQKALDLYNLNVLAHVGKAVHSLLDVDTSKTHISKALELNYNSFLVQFSFAHCCEHIYKDHAKAIQVLERLLDASVEKENKYQVIQKLVEITSSSSRGGSSLDNNTGDLVKIIQVCEDFIKYSAVMKENEVQLDKEKFKYEILVATQLCKTCLETLNFEKVQIVAGTVLKHFASGKATETMQRYHQFVSNGIEGLKNKSNEEKLTEVKKIIA